MRISSSRLTIYIILACAVFIPTMFQLAYLYSENKKLEQSTILRLPVTGVDPRDVIRGRYAILQIDWQPQNTIPETCKPKGKTYLAPVPNCGFCVNPKQNENASMTVLPYAKLSTKNCAVIFRNIMLSGDNFHLLPKNRKSRNMQLRVYLDESIANNVDRKLREGEHSFSADIVFTKQEIPVLRDFYINNQPYKTFLQGN